MAMSKARLGAALKAALDGINPNAGKKNAEENAKMLEACETIADSIIQEITGHADIVLTADITIPATGLVSGAPGAPVTGSAMNAPVTLSTKIK